jgi:hypothetical protein
VSGGSTAVPEPSCLLLLAVGIIMVAYRTVQRARCHA